MHYIPYLWNLQKKEFIQRKLQMQKRNLNHNLKINYCFLFTPKS